MEVMVVEVQKSRRDPDFDLQPGSKTQSPSNPFRTGMLSVNFHSLSSKLGDVKGLGCLSQLCLSSRLQGDSH